jgi:hypothetical protein
MRRTYTATMTVFSVLLVLLSLSSPLAAQDSVPQVEAASTATPAPAADWKADIEKRRSALITRNGSGTDTALRDELLTMREADQNARGIDYGQAKKEKPAGTLKVVDAQLTEQLKTIVDKDGWPTISLVGIEASNAAMLILTHTHDHAWQESLLPKLEELADTGKIDGSSLAFVIDRQLVSEGQLQRYGTQFKVVDGQMAMFGVEDPAGLDARRAKVFLPPLDAYKQQLEGMYHLKVSGKVVMAPLPVAAK